MRRRHEADPTAGHDRRARDETDVTRPRRQGRHARSMPGLDPARLALAGATRWLQAVAAAGFVVISSSRPDTKAISAREPTGSRVAWRCRSFDGLAGRVGAPRCARPEELDGRCRRRRARASARRAQTAVLADRVIENYRLPRPTVREAQWAVARANLARAVAVAPNIAGCRRRCATAMAISIASTAKRESGAAKRQPRSTSSPKPLTAFREAAELRSDWADPFLGLARTFIYGLRGPRAGRRCDEARGESRLSARRARDRAARRRLRARGDVAGANGRDAPRHDAGRGLPQLARPRRTARR